MKIYLIVFFNMYIYICSVFDKIFGNKKLFLFEVKEEIVKKKVLFYNLLKIY